MYAPDDTIEFSEEMLNEIEEIEVPSYNEFSIQDSRFLDPTDVADILGICMDSDEEE